MAYLESLYDGENILSLTTRFAQDGLSAQDVYKILQAGLMGGGQEGREADLEPPLKIDVDDGFEAASQAAAQLLERAFAPA